MVSAAGELVFSICCALATPPQTRKEQTTSTDDARNRTLRMEFSQTAELAGLGDLPASNEERESTSNLQVRRAARQRISGNQRENTEVMNQRESREESPNYC